MSPFLSWRVKPAGLATARNSAQLFLYWLGLAMGYRAAWRGPGLSILIVDNVPPTGLALVWEEVPPWEQGRS